MSKAEVISFISGAVSGLLGGFASGAFVVWQTNKGLEQAKLEAMLAALKMNSEASQNFSKLKLRKQDASEEIVLNTLKDNSAAYATVRGYCESIVWMQRVGLLPAEYWNEQGKFRAQNCCSLLEPLSAVNWKYNTGRKEQNQDGSSQKYHVPGLADDKNNRNSMFTYMEKHAGYKPQEFVKNFMTRN